ncbi:hypothetical protein ABW19_dt0203703 [Dactylella cylindrospora]|nr:hypothetical protein ABW19_dt0203703 [Dactylella cylindrospora]
MSTLFFPETYIPSLIPYLPSSTGKPSSTLPFTTLTFATSLDSSLSISPGVQTHLSGPLSKSMTHYLRSHHSHILIGVGTAVADDPGLNCRIDGAGIEGQPRPIILDPSGRWNPTEGSRVVRTAREGKGKAPWVVISGAGGIGEEGMEEKKRVVEAVGGAYIVIDAVDGQGRFRWRELLEVLRSEWGVESLMIEGGGKVINSLLEDDGAKELVDAVIVTIAPTWLGKGGVVVSPERRSVGFVPTRLKDVKWMPMGEDVVLCGRL